MTQTAEYRRLVRLAHAINRKAVQLGARGRISADDLLWIESNTWGNQCHYCGVALEVGQGTFDHVLPFAEGGHNTVFNLVRCCLTCNREKFTKTPDELAEWRQLQLTCPVCGRTYRPRWGEYKAGRGRVCSRRCSALKRHRGGAM